MIPRGNAKDAVGAFASRTAAHARALEDALGDPRDRAAPLSFARIVQADEASTYPRDAYPELAAAGLQAYCVPLELGGQLDSYEGLTQFGRTLARRDVTMTFSFALNTFLGAEAVWAFGAEPQRQRLAQRILRDNAIVGVGFSERLHGADLLASEVSAEPTDGGGYLLSGEKWTIGNATRGDVMTVFARTRVEGGPRGFSLFLVDKRDLAPGSFAPVPGVKTLGMRGADVSGLKFTASPLAADALIGSLGGGLELTVRSMQISRALAPLLSLGACDTVLRAAASWLGQRQIYGASALAIPYVRAQLAESVAVLLACEALVVSTARTLHLAPAQLAVTGAIAKALVPVEIDAHLQRIAATMGARYYMREGHYDGVVQKMLRDAPAANFGHGSSMVNLNAIAVQLRGLMRRRTRVADAATLERCTRLLDFDTEMPPADLSRLSLAATANDIVDALPALIEEVRALPAAASKLDVKAALLERLTGMQGMLEEIGAVLSGPPLETQSPEQYALAKRYAAIHTALCATASWLVLRARSGCLQPYAEGAWLLLAIDALVFKRHAVDGDVPRAWREASFGLLADLTRENLRYGASPWRLPGGGTPVD